jgi:hypothetical protein
MLEEKQTFMQRLPLIIGKEALEIVKGVSDLYINWNCYWWFNARIYSNRIFLKLILAKKIH